MRNSLCKKFFSLINDESGQAIVEYLLMLALVISAVTILSQFFKTTIRNVWVTIAKKVVAACPTGCQASGSIQ